MNSLKVPDRLMTVAVGQLGPIAREEKRSKVVGRLCNLMTKASERGAKVIAFPELALTTFFPRWYIEDQEEVDLFFEKAMPSPETQPLFDLSRRLGIGFYLGYAELCEENGATRRYNTSVLVGTDGSILGKYRKVHLPGHHEYNPKYPFQHLEKRYFDYGNLGFPVWSSMGATVGMCICNDRRWPETYRVMGLQGAEVIITGYNTPEANHRGHRPSHIQRLQHELSLQAGAYQNGAWVICAGKVGPEEGVWMMGGSCIVAPTGEIIARAQHDDRDELLVADCDLSACETIKSTIFNFTEHRRVEHYKLITEPATAEGSEK